jgi:DNA-binding NtrC family response regulator
MSKNNRAPAVLHQDERQTLEERPIAMRHKILIVDDEDGMRTFLSTILARAGYDIVTAESVQVGSSALAEALPDLLITDVRLGDFNGLQLLAMNPRAVPAIVVTGYPDPVLEAQARQFGAPFLLKPIEPAGLLTLVAELLQNRPRTAV